MIVRWAVAGFAFWCFLAGVWQHDWLLMFASLGLLAVFAFIGGEVRDDV